jgi:PAS domain S-box-containing protein
MPYGAAFIGLSVMALVWIGVLSHLRSERAQAEQAAQQNGSNLARAFEEHVVRTLSAVDEVLLDIRSSHASKPQGSDMSPRSEISRTLRDFVLQISIADKTGRIQSSNPGDPAGTADVSDRDYFQIQAKSTQDEIFVGSPVIGRLSKKWAIPITRRIVAPDGSFAGVIIAALDPSYFVRFYQSVDLGARGGVGLIGTDGIIRSRVAPNGPTIGQSIAGSELMQYFRERPTGNFRTTRSIDHMVRLVAYRAVSGFPLIVTVALAEDDVLASYFSNRAFYFAVATLLTLMTVVVTLLGIWRQAQLQQMRDRLLDDITLRKKIELDLRENRKTLDRAQHIAHLGSFVHDLVTGTVTWSDEFYRVLGLVPGEREESVETVTGLVLPGDVGKFRIFCDNLLKAEPSAALDFRVIRPDGTERMLHWENLVTRDEAGTPTAICGTVQDVTEHRQVELEIRKSRANLNRAQQLAHIGSFEHDLTTGKAHWSDEMYFLHDLDPDNGSANFGHLISALHPNDREHLASCRRELLQGRASLPFDYRVVRRDGTERVLRWNYEFTTDEAGKPMRLFGTSEDITERIQLEETLREARDVADRAVQTKAKFLATMSHEIRTPLSAVTGIIEELAETALNADQNQMVRLAHDSASSLRRLLDDILDFLKMEAGAVVIAPEPTELAHVINLVSETRAHEASKKGIFLTVEINTEVPRYVSIDPVRLRQILGNLLSNALKFTSHGAVRLIVSAVEEAGKATLAFAVSDTGIGISSEVLGRLFTPFTQADASTTRDFGGTGLGLAISRQLAGLMGGSLGCTSEEGVGSVFTLQLPLEVCEQPIAPSPTADAFQRFDGARALIAEDMPTNRWLLQRQLERMGFSVLAVENGEDALDALTGGSYDLLVTDFHMPKMDGAELTRHVREREARRGGVRLPILGLTADVTGTSRELCRAAGMDGVVSKPVNMKRLSAGLQALLQPQLEGPDPAADGSRQGAVFDESTYREIFDAGDPEGKQWLTEFITTAQIVLTDLRPLVATMDRVRLAATAHKLASSSVVAGAMMLGECMRGIEARASDADKDELLGAVAAAEAAYTAATGAILRCIGQAGELVS